MNSHEKMFFLKLALTALVFTLATHTAFAIAPAPGDIDTSFNGGVPAVIDRILSVDIRPDAAAVDPTSGDILWAANA